MTSPSAYARTASANIWAVVGEHRLERVDGRQLGGARELAGAAGDVHGLIGDALDVHAGLHRGDDQSKVGCDGLEADEEFDALAVDLDFEQVDFLVVGDDDVAEVVVALEEAFAALERLRSVRLAIMSTLLRSVRRALSKVP